MGPIYPELVEFRGLIEETLRIEEEAFARTLDAATERLAALLSTNPSRIDGADAFRLYDTFGLPIELTDRDGSRARGNRRPRGFRGGDAGAA